MTTTHDLARLIARRDALMARDYDAECHQDFMQRLAAVGIPKTGLLTDEQAQVYRRIQHACLAEYHQMRYAAMWQIKAIADAIKMQEQREAA